MEYLSKRKLKAFASRFSFEEKGHKEKIKRVPITLENARQAVARFISPLQSDLKTSFVETRIRLLKICLEEKAPLERWVKARDFLLEDSLQDHELEPSGNLSYLMNQDSLLNQCIKVVVLFNLTDDNVSVPEDMIIEFSFRIEHSFPNHRLIRHVISLKAITIEGEVTERLIPANQENLSSLLFGVNSDNRFSVTYSILIDQNSQPHIIKHDDFFDKFTKSYKDIVKKYHLDSSMKLSDWFHKLQNPIDIYSGKERQVRFLKELTGKNITKVRWEAERITKIVISKVVKEYFPDVQKEIISIKPRFPRLWKPDNYLFDEDLLRYELIDLYLKRFEPYKREKLLKEHIEDISIFNLKTFRELIAKWESDKETESIIRMLKRLESHYNKQTKNPKEREKMIEYLKICSLIQQGFSRMGAYRSAARPNEKVNTVEQRYIRLRKKLGNIVNDPQHLEKIKKDWEINPWDLT